MKIKYLIILQLLSAIPAANGQELLHPNFAMKSHETLELQKILFQADKTILYMSIENRITGGNFCVDKKVRIILPSGEKVPLTEASGIPVCPQVYDFKTVGEKLVFTLTFPPVPQGTLWFDLIEECSANCFWLYGITLDKELNNRLDQLFLSAEKNTPEQNIKSFRSMLEEADGKNHGIEGLLYLNIINAAQESGDRVEAAVWYNRLKNSAAPRREMYLKYLNDTGVKF